MFFSSFLSNLKLLLLSFFSSQQHAASNELSYSNIGVVVLALTLCEISRRRYFGSKTMVTLNLNAQINHFSLKNGSILRSSRYKMSCGHQVFICLLFKCWYTFTTTFSELFSEWSHCDSKYKWSHGATDFGNGHNVSHNYFGKCLYQAVVVFYVECICFQVL